jgi:hypothetical protein
MFRWIGKVCSYVGEVCESVGKLFLKPKRETLVVQVLMKAGVDLMLKHGPDSIELNEFIERHKSNTRFVYLIEKARRLKKSAQVHT